MTSERTPRGGDWELWPGVADQSRYLASSRWRSGPVLVVSTLDVADYPDGKGQGPQWHISISAMGKRPSRVHVRRAVRAFGMQKAEEDNHHPGVARNFYMPVDPAHRVDCECKEADETITERDGYTWSNPRPGSAEACRGCEYEGTFGKACPVHGERR